MKPVVSWCIVVLGMFLVVGTCFAQMPNFAQMGHDAYNKHAYADGAPLLLLAAQLDPNNAGSLLYNAACCYALAGQKDLALYSLGTAIKKGWKNKSQTESDEDLASLRSDPRWKACMSLFPETVEWQDNRDAIINDLNNLAAHAFQYRIRPNSMGGGAGSFSGYQIPPKMTSNGNATYETPAVGPNLIQFKATSAKGNGTVETSIDQEGRLKDWKYTGKFAEPPKAPEGASKRDAIVNDLNNLAAQAYQYRVRPTSMGGGQGSYSGFKIPSRMASNANATYETLVVERNLIRYKATASKGDGTVESSIDQDGRLHDWKFGGEFAASAKDQYGRSPLTANRDALINHLNNIAAYCYQYRIRPASMGGGNGAYTGATLPEKLALTDDGTFALEDVGANSVKIQAVSKKFKGSITTLLDADGRMSNWTYFGELQ